MTKREFYNEIMELATANERQDIVEFCEHEIELLDKKKSNGKAKVNETMSANIDLVYAKLSGLNEKVTATELISKTNLEPLANEFGIVTVQKVSAYLNKLVECGKVEKTTEKKKTYFKAIN